MFKSISIDFTSIQKGIASLGEYKIDYTKTIVRDNPKTVYFQNNIHLNLGTIKAKVLILFA